MYLQIISQICSSYSYTHLLILVATPSKLHRSPSNHTAENKWTLVNSPLGFSSALLINLSDGVTSGFSSGLKNFDIDLPTLFTNHMT